jgi:uncharacterized membrane protein
MRHVRHTQRLIQRQEQLGFKGRLAEPPGWVDRFADTLSATFGTMWFLAANVLFFTAWIVVNEGWIPGIPAFDPFPFNLLTTAVSLEAIALTIVVLISQNFQSRIADMRAELDFEINVRAEKEVTKLIAMVRQIQEQLGIDCSADPEREEMERETDIVEIQETIRQQSLHAHGK